MMAESMNICSSLCQEHLFAQGTNVPMVIATLGRMKRQVANIFIKNLYKLKEFSGDSFPAIARKSGLTPRGIRYYLDKERCPSIEIVEAIANAYGFTSVHLLMDDFEPVTLKGGGFDKLYHTYNSTDEEGRRVLDTTGEYVAHRKEAPANGPKTTPHQRQSGS